MNHWPISGNSALPGSVLTHQGFALTSIPSLAPITAGRTRIPNEFGGLGATNKQVMSQFWDIVVVDIPDSKFRVQYANFAKSAGHGEWTMGSAATGRASVYWINSSKQAILTQMTGLDGNTTVTAPDGGYFNFIANIRPMVGTGVLIRFWGNFPNGGYYSHYMADYNNGDVLRYGATTTDLTNTTTTFSDTYQGSRDHYPPTFVGGTARPGIRSVGIHADSREIALGDVPNTLFGLAGPISRVIGPYVPTLNAAVPGMTLAEDVISANSTRAIELLKRCTDVFYGGGINDIIFQGVTDPNAWTNQQTIKARVGKNSFYKTLDPVVTNQTTNTVYSLANDAQRIAYNVRLRALSGSPILDAATVLESTVTPGTLLSLGDTNDGTHETNVGNQKVVAANNFNFALLGSPTVVSPGFQYPTGALYQSLDFTDSWTAQTATFTTNNIFSPSHKITATVLKEDATAASQHNFFKQPTLTLANTTKTYTIFAKRVVGSRNIQFTVQKSGGNFASARIWVNLSTGVANVVEQEAGVMTLGSYTSTAYEDWWKIVMPVTYAAGVPTNPYCFVRIADSTGIESFNGDNTSSIAVWGFDVR